MDLVIMAVLVLGIKMNTLASASAIGQERTVKPSVSALLNIVIVINNENDLNCISFIRYWLIRGIHPSIHSSGWAFFCLFLRSLNILSWYLSYFLACTFGWLYFVLFLINSNHSHTRQTVAYISNTILNFFHFLNC